MPDPRDLEVARITVRKLECTVIRCLQEPWLPNGCDDDRGGCDDGGMQGPGDGGAENDEVRW